MLDTHPEFGKPIAEDLCRRVELEDRNGFGGQVVPLCMVYWIGGQCPSGADVQQSGVGNPS